MPVRKDRQVSADRFKKVSVTTPMAISLEDPSILRPINPVINFPSIGPLAGGGYNYDMGKHYGKGFDPITNFVYFTIMTLLKNSKNGSEETKHSLLQGGFKNLAEYLEIWHSAIGRELTPDDFTPAFIKNYIAYLRGSGVGYTSQDLIYQRAKSLLRHMRNYGYWVVDTDTYEDTFPNNPWPKAGVRKKGARPFTEHERYQVVVALKDALKPIYDNKRTEPLTGYELALCVLAIAMQTGINTTPLLEMTTDCLVDHPIIKHRKLLTVFKRRGSGLQAHSVRQSESRELELVRGVKLDVARLIERMVELNKPLRELAKSDLILVYMGTGGPSAGTVTSLSEVTLRSAIKALAQKYDLKDEDGKPIAINISRIRKTVINGRYELSGGNILLAAKGGKWKDAKTADSYWIAPEQSKRNLGLLGEIRVLELTSQSDIKPTPTASCKDPINGDRAPKNGSPCLEFLACFRCKSFVVTGDDLYRVYSLYWAIVRSRDIFGRKEWKRHLSNVRAVIDEELEPAFIKQGMESHLQTEKERARTNPHPYWTNLDMLRIGK
jgi:hypothetical protein